MLFDPKWEKLAPEELLKIENLIAWLETKDPTVAYSYMEPTSCLLAQYIRASGYPDAHCGGYWLGLSTGSADILIPEGLKDIAWEWPRTFGAALKRAKAWIR
jgi:hypothetical protein